MPSDSDYSRIQRLLEFERLYQELQERVSSDLADRDTQIRELQAELSARQAGGPEFEARLHQLEEERERALRAIDAQRVEYETKIERLQARVRELSADAGAPVATSSGRGGGLFRR